MTVDDDKGNFNPVDETNRLYAAVFHPASIFPKYDTCSGLHGGVYL